MANSEFKPFATGAGANVTSQKDWEELPELFTGFQSGKASSAEVNKALRQASFISAALAQFVADKSGSDIADDGDVAAFIAKLTKGFGAQYLNRANPFADIKADGATAIAAALANLGLGEAAKMPAAIAQNSPVGNISFPAKINGLDSTIIFQWMSVAVADNLGTGTITLPKTFPNKTLFAMVGDAMGSDISPTNLGWRTDITTQSVIGWRSSSPSGNGAIVIFAIGF